MNTLKMSLKRIVLNKRLSKAAAKLPYTEFYDK